MSHLKEPAVQLEVVAAYQAQGKVMADSWARGCPPGSEIKLVEPLLPVRIIRTEGYYQNLHDPVTGINALFKIEQIPTGPASLIQKPTIHIGCPCWGLPDAAATQFCLDLSSLLSGAAVHEYIHWLQSKEWPIEFEAAKKQGFAAATRARSDPKNVEAVTEYYQCPFEIAAHGGQAACEMLDRSCEFSQTHLFERIEVRFHGAVPQKILEPIEAAALRYYAVWEKAC